MDLNIATFWCTLKDVSVPAVSTSLEALLNLSTIQIDICAICRCMTDPLRHAWLTPNNAVPSHVLLCRIWAFCAKECKHKYGGSGESPKIGEHAVLLPFGMLAWLTTYKRPSPYVIPHWILVILCSIFCFCLLHRNEYCGNLFLLLCFIIGSQAWPLACKNTPVLSGTWTCGNPVK